MKQFLIALAMLFVACSSIRQEPSVDSSTHGEHLHVAQVPDATLRPDEFDAASPISVAEAAKAAGEVHATSHEHHAAPTAKDAEETTAIYVCPMHPEVTSATPGKCPKCGMTLIQRDRK